MSGIPFPVSGQDGQPLKVRIVMRNQKTIQGRLFVKNLPVILSVYITDQDSIAIPTKIIQQITLEKETDKVTNRITYFNNTFVGILTGRTNSQSSYRSMVTVEMVNGVKINTYFWPGVGIAFDQFPEVSTLPFFLSIRGDLLVKTFTPFYFFDIGTGPSWNAQDPFSTEQETDARLMFHLGSGIKIYSDSGINVMLSFGFKSQRIEFTQTLWNDQEEILKRNYKNFSFRIGIGF
jgi:hypothetical protein